MSDTITAIATPLGEGGIGVVRIGGDESFFIMKKMFKECPENIKPRHTYFGHVINIDGEVIDEAVFIYMKGPASYTGEDMVEIQAHGSNVSLKQIVRTAIDHGARMAEPGEFTKLAFLNGKIDLSQAEAVIDIIKARTDMTLDIAEKQKEGRLSETIESIRETLLDVLAKMAVNIDYPDEDIEETQYDDHITDLRWVQSSVEDLKKIAENQVKKQMVLDEIIKRENISATDEQKEETAQRYYYSSAEDMINKNGEDVAKQLYQNEAAVQYLIQNAVFNAAEETTEAGAAETETTDSTTETK